MNIKRATSSSAPANPVPIRRVPGGIGRIPVLDVSPVIEDGVYPVKCVVGEQIPIRASVFREGHDSVRASVILISPDGRSQRVDMVQIEPMGLDIWEAAVRPDSAGQWTFRVEGWSDPWGTWVHHATAKLPAGVDIELVCAEGRALFAETAILAEQANDPESAKALRSAAGSLQPEHPVADLISTATSPQVDAAIKKHGPRLLLSPTKEFPIRVERRLAAFSAWYEFFPRSQGAHFDESTQTWFSGNFDSSYERLEAAAAMGFDIVYLPPIHPIGSAFRKGRNNSLNPAKGDPGSPWAIGGAEGGHDAIHPDLGDFDSFERFVGRAKDLGLEVALDFALQASPDHPWVKEHPEWFTTRIDGTIAYAENPPKKYQDIYPINFDNDPEGIYNEALRVIRFWIAKGVSVFRVDNPHTKPVNFWSWLLEEVYRTNPEVIFLAEAFTRPQMMHALGKIGFHQSYTYFTWRNAKWELEEYLGELSRHSAGFFRPSFWVNTPDINPFFLQSGRPAAFAIRAILAATMAPSWGVYSGFELLEHEPFKQGGEEYLNSEKYEYRPRDFTAKPNLNLLLGRLNEIRRHHPALQQLRNIEFHHVPHEGVIAFSKRDGDDLVIVVCSLLPDTTVETEVYLDLGRLGVESSAVLNVVDQLSDASYTWGARNFIRLSPDRPAHILVVRK